MPSLHLPTTDGRIEPYKLAGEPCRVPPEPPAWNRRVFAAAHVVVDPFADIDPTLVTAIDWERTLAFREYLWSLGFGVAEAMDTAQRGMGLDWPHALELVQRSVRAAQARGGGLIASGAGTDHLPDGGASPTLDAVTEAYLMQCEAIEAAGSQVILMASRALAKAARGPEDYLHAYGKVLGQLQRPAILHWLGEMFDPALAGYWGTNDVTAAMSTALQVIGENRAKVDGIKISLLSAEREIEMRRALPRDVVMYTGDDFNYPDLIAGDDQGFSHALLGIFDPIAPAAATALAALSLGDRSRYDAVMAPTVPLSRHIFKTPTRFYKTGVVFLAYLNGFQDHFTMLAGQENARSTLHLAELLRLADKAGVLLDPDMAASRAKPVFAVRGIEC
jgi:hypothetical protein